MSALPDPDYASEFYASVPAKRLLAWVIDGFIVFGLTSLIVLLTAFVGLWFWGVIFLVVGFAYRVVTIANTSATWGMYFTGIELRAANGSRFDTSLSFLHTLGYTISVSIPILQIISIVLMLTSARKQGLTDMMLGSVVINRRA
ncbi:RDD family protein [Epibacterium ulvae]|uniref:RDD family protein n=1 Tax=Epibacterium ulvae TaxID=1156985 RepID=UPI002493BE77|nr:RDD family protein [Epibacterium ulvae]